MHTVCKLGAFREEPCGLLPERFTMFLFEEAKKYSRCGGGVKICGCIVGRSACALTATNFKSVDALRTYGKCVQIPV